MSGLKAAGQIHAMSNKQEKLLTAFGFSFEKGGPHTSRTLMVSEVSALMGYVHERIPPKEEFQRLIIEENCLSKRSGRSRKLSFRYLADLYSLNADYAIFRAYCRFCKSNPDSIGLLSMLLAYARDPLVRLSFPFIIALNKNTVITREDTEKFITDVAPDRFSKATLRSTAQNINGSWTLAGHLTGKVKKKRTTPIISPEATAYSLLLAYLTGCRGDMLFSSPFVQLLDHDKATVIESAEAASRKGLLVFKRIGDICEVGFPSLLTAQEMELIYEQS